ncbi:MAG: PQQ-binding-like beta-propeller repeat protein [Acidobacteriia bacterium]|nr:PQQ-binding-like beta-propeller repeat protein [Terriglobia bacterium]
MSRQLVPRRSTLKLPSLLIARRSAPFTCCVKPGSKEGFCIHPDLKLNARIHNAVGLFFLLAFAAFDTNWAVNGGPDNIRYTTLSQISPANVGKLRLAWTYDAHDAFKDSEMQSNPIVVDGMLYATTPKLRVIALDAATGREIWSFDPNQGSQPGRRYRHRGVTVYKDRVFFTHRNFLWALDRKTGKPIQGFGDNGRVDLRNGMDRPAESITISASSPGVIFEDLYIMGSTVPETLPGSPGHIRAFDVNTGKQRWIFHTIPHPGEFGYETWPPEAYKISGGANAWAGLTIDTKNAMVFAATGSASFDFYGSNRVGNNLFADCVLALDARTGKRVWHFQAIKHDVWDLDFPAAPSLVTVTRDGKKVEAVAQITKTGYVYVFNRRTGEPLFPIAYRKAPPSPLDGEKLAATQPYPVKPPPFTRQAFTEDMITTRTPEAHKAVLDMFRKLDSNGMFTPPSLRGTILMPGTDGGGEWGGAAFDPETALLYVNSNEQPWVIRMVTHDTSSLYNNNCASCHRADRKGTPPEFPSLVDIGKRRSREDIAAIIREGTGRMPGFDHLGRGINEIVDFLLTGKDNGSAVPKDVNWQKYRNEGYILMRDPEGYPPLTPPWGTLNAIDLNKGEIRWRIPFGEYPELVAKGIRNTGSDNYGGPVVTSNGLLFIGATNFDKKFRAYDKLTGKLLWETVLPAAGNATPSVYEIGGREYVVIVCGGGKNGAPSGSSIVAFALPR